MADSRPCQAALGVHQASPIAEDMEKGFVVDSQTCLDGNRGMEH